MTLKILAIGDAGQPTGFERVFRGNLDSLLDTGKYDIVGLGLGFNGNPEMPYRFPVYPANTAGDYFSFSDLPKQIQKHKPDVLWIVQDLWNIMHAMPYKPVDLPAVAYFPVDTPNMKWSYAIACGALAAPVAYTKFGAVETAAGVQDTIDILLEGMDKKQLDMDAPRTWLSIPHGQGLKQNLRMDYLAKWQNLESWNVIPHGHEHGKFFPVPKYEARLKLGINQQEFLIGSINANQFRKRQDLVLRAFAVIKDECPNAKLLFWCHSYDERGWDLEQLARYYGVADRVYFVHRQTEFLTDEELNFLYNACDVMINMAGGEGWGLTAIEGGACGVPQMVPDWSATREIWGEDGLLIPVEDYRAEPKFLNTLHAVCSVSEAARMLKELYNDRDLAKEWGNKARAMVDKLPSWKETGQAFDRVIQKAIATNATPQALSFNQIMQKRTTRIRSEFHDLPLIPRKV